MANISYDLVKTKYNHFIVHLPSGSHLPDIDNPGKVNGVTVEFVYVDGTTIPMGGDVYATKVVIENTPVEGQGTTSKKYYRWNLRWKTGSDTVFKYWNGDTYLGVEYDAKKKGRIDELGYKSNKICAKKNIASFPQSHKMGSCNIYNDLYKDCVPDSQWSERVAVHQHPFIGFQEINGQITYIGHYTSGADKGDKATFGYDVESEATSHQLQIEGPNHDPLATLFQFPWIKDANHQGLKYVAVDEAGEAVEGLRNVDLKDGNSEAWDVSIAGAHFDGSAWVENGTDVKEDESYIQAILDEDWRPAYNFVYYTDPNIQYSSQNPATITTPVRSNNSVCQLYDSAMHLWFWNGKVYEQDETHNMNEFLGISGFQTAEKVIAARRAKNKSGLKDYFNINSAVFHYCYCLLIGAKDNFAKNTYPQLHHSLATGGRWEWKQDDLDSVLSTDNSGTPTVGYDVEYFDTDASGVFRFQGANSALWREIHENFTSEVQAMMNNIVKGMVNRSSKKDGTTHERVLQFFRDYYFAKAQLYFPAKDYNADFEFGYREPWFKDRAKAYNNVLPLTQVTGDMLLGESQWLERRVLYILSKFELDGFTKSQNDGYGSLEFRPASDVTMNLVTALSFYPNINAGDSVENLRPANPRIPIHGTATISIPSAGGTTYYVKGLDYLEDLGDLRTLQLNAIGGGDSLSIASKRLQKLKFGDADASTVTTNIKGLTLNCPALREIDLRNTGITSNIDIKDSKRAQRVLLGGTEVPMVSLAPGSQIVELEYSDKCENIILPSLFNLNMDGLTLPADESKISGFYCKDTPLKSDIGISGPIQLVNQIANTADSSLKYISLIWSEPTTVTESELAQLYGLLVNASERGYGHIDMDDYGNISLVEGAPYFSGTLKVNRVVSVIKSYIEANSDIVIDAAAIVIPTPEQVGLTVEGYDVAVPENALDGFIDKFVRAGVINANYAMFEWSIPKYDGQDLIKSYALSMPDSLHEKLTITSVNSPVAKNNNPAGVEYFTIRARSLADMATWKNATLKIQTAPISQIGLNASRRWRIHHGDGTIVFNLTDATNLGTKPWEFIGLKCNRPDTVNITRMDNRTFYVNLISTDTDITFDMTAYAIHGSGATTVETTITMNHCNAPTVDFHVNQGEGIRDVKYYICDDPSIIGPSRTWSLVDPSYEFCKWDVVKVVCEAMQEGYVYLWSDGFEPAPGEPLNERVFDLTTGAAVNVSISAVNMSIAATYEVPSGVATMKLHNGMSPALMDAVTTISLTDNFGVTTDITSVAKTSAPCVYTVTPGTYSINIYTVADPVTNGLCNGLFADCINVTSLQTPVWRTTGVTDMSNMFNNICYGCTALESVNILAFDTSTVVNADSMLADAFYNCSSLQSAVFPDAWTFERLESAESMCKEVFYNCSSLQGVTVSLWSLGNLGYYANFCDNMFYGANSFARVNVNGECPVDASGEVINTQFDLNSWYECNTVATVYLYNNATATFGMIHWFPNATYVSPNKAGKLTGFILTNCHRNAPMLAGPDAQVRDKRLNFSAVDTTLSLKAGVVAESGYDTIVTELGTAESLYTVQDNRYIDIEAVNSEDTGFCIDITYGGTGRAVGSVGNLISNGVITMVKSGDDVIAGPNTVSKWALKSDAVSNGSRIRIYTGDLNSVDPTGLLNSMFSGTTVTTVKFPAWLIHGNAPEFFVDLFKDCNSLTTVELPLYDIASVTGSADVFSKSIVNLSIPSTVRPAHSWIDAACFNGQFINIKSVTLGIDADAAMINVAPDAIYHYSGTDNYLTVIHVANASSALTVFYTEVSQSTHISATATGLYTGVFVTNKDASITNAVYSGALDWNYTPNCTSHLDIAGVKSTAEWISNTVATADIYVPHLTIPNGSLSALNVWDIKWAYFPNIKVSQASTDYKNMLYGTEIIQFNSDFTTESHLPVTFGGHTFDASNRTNVKVKDATVNIGNAYNKVVTNSSAELALKEAGFPRVGGSFEDVGYCFLDFQDGWGTFTFKDDASIGGDCSWYNDLPSTCMSVPAEFFKGTHITKFNCPRVTSIGENALEGCPELNTVVLGYDADPANTGRVAGWAYSGKTVDPLTGVTTYAPPLEITATFSCSTGDTLQFLGANSNVGAYTGYLLYDPNGNLVRNQVGDWGAEAQEVEATYPGNYTLRVQVPAAIAGTLTFGNNLFNGCSKLTSVEFPDVDTTGVTLVADSFQNTFTGCGALTSINMPVYNLSSSATATGIGNMDIPNTVHTINITTPVAADKNIFNFNDAFSVCNNENLTINLTGEQSVTKGFVNWFPNAVFKLSGDPAAYNLTSVMDTPNVTSIDKFTTPGVKGTATAILTTGAPMLDFIDVVHVSAPYNTVVTSLCKTLYSPTSNKAINIEGINSGLPSTHCIDITYGGTCNVWSNEPELFSTLSSHIYYIKQNGTIVAGPNTAYYASSVQVNAGDRMQIYTDDFSTATDISKLLYNFFGNNAATASKVTALELPSWSFSTATVATEAFYNMSLSGAEMSKLVVPLWSMANCTAYGDATTGMFAGCSETTELYLRNSKPTKSILEIYSAIHGEDAPVACNSINIDVLTYPTYDLYCLSGPDTNFNNGGNVYTLTILELINGVTVVGKSNHSGFFVKLGESESLQVSTGTHDIYYATNRNATVGNLATSGTWSYTPTCTSFLDLCGCSMDEQIFSTCDPTAGIYTPHLVTLADTSTLAYLAGVGCMYAELGDIDTTEASQYSNFLFAALDKPFQFTQNNNIAGATSTVGGHNWDNVGYRTGVTPNIFAASDNIIVATSPIGTILSGAGHAHPLSSNGYSFKDLSGIDCSDFAAAIQANPAALTGDIDFWDNMPSDYWTGDGLDGAFKDTKISSFESERLTSIPDNMFEGSSLTSLDVPNVTSVGTDALKGCNSLDSFTCHVPGTAAGGTIGGWDYGKCIDNGDGTYTYTAPAKCSVVYNLSSASALTAVAPSVASAVILTKPNGATVDYTDRKGSPITLDASDFTAPGDYTLTFTLPAGQIPADLCKEIATAKSISMTEPITQIGNYAFQNCSQLTSVSFAPTVESIGTSAFQGTALTSLVLPDACISVGNSAFISCSSLASVNLNKVKHLQGGDVFRNSGILTLTIPNTVEDMSISVFNGCTSLNSVVFADGNTSLTTIPEMCFSGCTSLTSVTGIPASVTTIGNQAFSNNKFSKITLPESLATIGNQAFQNCTALTSITLPDTVTSLGISCFSGCTSLNNPTLSANVNFKVLPNECFRNCTSLDTITIPSQITNINESCFQGSGLTSVVLPNSVTTLGTAAFQSCSSLTSITFPTNTNFKVIPRNCFNGCSYLTTLNLPNTVEDIYSESFRGCPIANIVIPSAVKNIATETSATGSAFGWAGNAIKTITFDNSACDVGRSAFYALSDGVTSIDLGNSLKSLGDMAFQGLGNAFTATVNIPDTCTSIGAQALKGVKSFTGGIGVTSLGDAALDPNITVENPYFPAITSASNLGDNNFKSSAIKSVTLGFQTAGPGVISGFEFGSCTSDGSGHYVYKQPAVVTNTYLASTPGTLTIASNITGFSKATLISSTGTETPIDPIATTVEVPSAGVWKVKFTCPSGNCTNCSFADITTLTATELQDITIGASYSGCSALTSIDLGTVTQLVLWQFSGCSALTSITIPNTLTAFGSAPFRSCTSLSSVTFADGYSCSTFGPFAFQNCSALHSITIPDSVTTISESAFTATGLTSITIPDSVTSLGINTFQGCSSLESVIFDGTPHVLTIPNGCFQNCSSLTSITIPASVTTLGNDVFKQSGLTSINIPAAITSIGDYAFQNCSSLDTLTFDAGSELASIGGYAFSNSKVTSADLSTLSNLAILGDFAFNGCSSLTSITLPDTANFTAISQGCFWSSALNTVTLPSHVESIGNNSFCNCSHLTSADLGSVKSIGDSAFWDSKLASIVIPDTVESIANNAFHSIPATTVDLGNGAYSVGNTAFSINSNYTISNGSHITSLGNGSLSGNYTNTTLDFHGITSASDLGDNNFKGTSLQSVKLGFYTDPTVTPVISGFEFGACVEGPTGVYTYKQPATVVNTYTISDISAATNIFSEAYPAAVSITLKRPGESTEIDITDRKSSAPIQLLPSDYTTAGTYTVTVKSSSGDVPYHNGVTALRTSNIQGFTRVLSGAYMSSSLTSVTLGEGLTSIEGSAFQNCYSLTSVAIPNSVTSLGIQPFQGCSALSSVTLGSGLTSLPSSCFYNCTSLNNVTLPDNITSIGDNCFSGCSALTSIDLNKVNTLGVTAFQNCSHLASVDLGDVTTLGPNAGIFSSCPALTTVDLSNVTAITGANTFQYSGLTSVTIPALTTWSGTSTFNNCKDLASIAFDSAFSLDTIPVGVFSYCGINSGHELTSVTLPVSVTHLGNDVFKGSNKLASVNLDNLITIGDSAFNNTGFTSVVLPDSLTTLGTQCFLSCSSLTSVTFPDNPAFTTIPDRCFAQCQNAAFTSVTIPDTVTSVGASAFNGDFNLSVSLPDNLVTIGDQAFYVCNNTSVVIPDSVTSIGNQAFVAANSLHAVSVDLGHGSYTVGDQAFYHYGANPTLNLTTFTNGENITALGAQALSSQSGNQGNTSFNFPHITSESNLGDNNFTGSNLKSVALGFDVNTNPLSGFSWSAKSTASGVTTYKGPDSFSMSYNVADTSAPVKLANSITTDRPIVLTRPDGTTATLTAASPLMLDPSVMVGPGDYTLDVQSSAFDLQNTTALTHLVVGAGATQPPYCIGCSNLVSVELPNTITTFISNANFANCTSLTTINIPDSVTNLGTNTFGNCSSLTDIDLPDTITELPTKCFEGCASLNTIDVSHITTFGTNCLKGVPGITSIDLTGCTVGAGVFYGCSNLSDVTLDPATTAIPNELFRGCSALTEIDLPASCVSIGNTAFSGSGLTSIDLSNVTSFSTSSFNGCSSLNSPIVINDAVTSIPNELFRGCSALTDVTLGSGVTSIGNNAFLSAGLTDIDLTGVTSIGNSAFSGCSALTSVDIPDSVTSIGNSAFQSCTALATLTIGSGVTEIPQQCFRQCALSGTLDIPANVTKIGVNAFSYPQGTTPVSIVFHEGLQEIGEGAFYTPSITDVGCTISDFPASLTSIGNQAFNKNHNITSVVFHGDGSGLTIGNSAFESCTGVTTLDLTGVTSIGNSAFSGCSSLTSVTFPADSTLTEIPYGCFNVCHNLVTCELPASITTIGGDAFLSCVNWAPTSLPSNLESIGNNAFNNNTAMNTSLTSCTIKFDNGTVGGSGKLGGSDNGWSYSSETDNGDGTFTYNK